MPRTRLIAYPSEDLRQRLDAYVAQQRRAYPAHDLSESTLICIVLEAGLQAIAQCRAPPIPPRV